MARKKREWYEGACYHVMGRGNRKCAIFKEREDYTLFMILLCSVKERFPFDLHACCLMTNHFHLELTTQTDPIWKIMQPLMNHYARTFNQKYNYEGHLFDSRYTSCLIRDDIYFLEVSRYIHLNPVKAMMVREPLAYEYSSYSMYVDKDNESGKTGGKDFMPGMSGIVDTSRILCCFRHNPREQYRMFVEGKISHAEQEMLIQKDMKEDELWLPW
jgi:REP element-mobilizing transposase RayT